MFHLQWRQVDELFEYSSLNNWYISAWQMSIQTENKKMHKGWSVAHVDVAKQMLKMGPKQVPKNNPLISIQCVILETPVPLFTAGDYDYFQIK